LAYVLGLGIPLYIFSSFSAGLFQKMRAVNKYTGRIQQVFGLIMIITAILIYTNYAQVLQARVLNLFPGYSRFLGQFENNGHLQTELDKLAGRQAQKIDANSEQLLSNGGPAPDFAGIAHWLNSGPLTMASLRGKVLLVDFWTYSCINCVRTLPHLTAWYDRYKDEGLVIVGVHTPEFAFERQTANVARAIKQFGINYPVAQDNDYQTWKNYQNHYWPAEYLIDAKGAIRHVHFGEGSYDKTEEAIRALLKENGHAVKGGLSVVHGRAAHRGITPETYLGTARAPRENPPFAFEGQWQRSPQRATAGANAVLTLNFKADKVFLVAGPAHAGDRIKVFMDGKPANDIILDTERLYNVVDLHGKVESHILRLEFPNQGTAVYAFTFG
jgi:thiol-disulfide isomerase/thioredoxin